ncbi:MAG: RNA-binding cell elongation regulator Jag/EloR [Actinomycetota bacterium]
MEWVEATGKTVEIAVEAAIAELGLESPEQANVEVIQEAKAGFIGVGARPAVVKVSRKPRRKNRRSRRKPKTQDQKNTSRKPKDNKGSRAKKAPRPAEKKKGGAPKERRSMKDEQKATEPKTEKPDLSIEDQAAVAGEFLSGLLDAFGLEGDVQTRIEDEVLYLDVVGEQTEALVGAKGSTMHAVLELTRTTIQRRTYGAPRMRIDIAGYGARRREALTIYTGKLVEQITANGGEVMLEPMNAADRKVVHDAAAAHEGVRTYSEGEDPRRAVVIAAVEESGDES